MSQVPPGIPSGRSWLTLSHPLPLAASLCLGAQAAAHTIPVDLLMDLIAFQLIAPHASTKLNQAEVPSTSLVANLILLDIIIRWYWLVMTQHFQDRGEGVRHASQRGLWRAVHFRSCEGSRCSPPGGVSSLIMCLWLCADTLLCTAAHWPAAYCKPRGWTVPPHGPTCSPVYCFSFTEAFFTLQVGGVGDHANQTQAGSPPKLNSTCVR